MSVADKINSIKTHVADAYAGIASKGGTVPSDKNIENLKAAIETISTGDDRPLQAKTVTPSKAQQVVNADPDYSGLSQVTVEAIPDDYIIPSGALEITANGTYDVTDKASAVVAVPTSGGAGLNIEYSQTAPTDTSKLWIKSTEPASIEFSQNPEQQVQGLTVLDETISAGNLGINCAAVGTKIYLFGGDSYVAIREFDIETKTITTLSATLPQALSYGSCAAVGTKIYLFSGGIIQEFDTETKTATTLSATLPTQAIKSIACASVGTKIYLFGGYYVLRTTAVQVNTIVEFDTETKTATTLSARLPQATSAMGCAAVGTKIYLFGGRLSSTTLTNAIQEFDIETKTITTLSATLPATIENMGCAAVGANIYLFGGFVTNITNAIREFDIETKTITTLSATLPQANYRMGCAAVGANIYLFGGSLNSIYEFIINFPLTSGNILAQQDYDKNIFTIVKPPTKVTIGVKNVYKGNSNNVAEFVDAYLHDGAKWVNINTGAAVQTNYYAPTISLSGSTLTITPDSRNTNVGGYKVYDGETIVTTTTSLTINLSAYITTEGDHTITVKTTGTAYGDSPASNAVVYTVTLPTLSTPTISLVSGTTIQIDTIDDNATTIEVFADGVSIGTVDKSTGGYSVTVSSATYVETSSGSGEGTLKIYKNGSSEGTVLNMYVQGGGTSPVSGKTIAENATSIQFSYIKAVPGSSTGTSSSCTISSEKLGGNLSFGTVYELTQDIDDLVISETGANDTLS